MPYSSNVELPLGVRSHLPGAAQDIYREAFNHAWSTYAGDPRREDIAHRVAWAAVKRRYQKVGKNWGLLDLDSASLTLISCSRWWTPWQNVGRKARPDHGRRRA